MTDGDPTVSVVVPTYSRDRHDDLLDCVDAARSQSHGDVEVVIVVDGNDALHDDLEDRFGEADDVVTVASSPHVGPISRANMGGVAASGDIVALTDDDAVPHEDWVEVLVDTFDRHDAVAVGGRVDPDWVAGEPGYLPAEFYWLIGATYRGFPEEEREVRNTFGANLAYRRDAFMRLGGFKLGGLGDDRLQGRETEFCARLRQEYGEGVIYNPDAVVEHKIYEYRTELVWNLKRAFWQGYSKRGMERYLPDDGGGDESAFLGLLLGESIPERLRGALGGSRRDAVQLVMLVVLTGMVGLGYVWALLRWR